MLEGHNRAYDYRQTIIFADQDECAVFSPCEHACENTDGSFLCACAEGYEITNDGRTCEGIMVKLINCINFHPHDRY